MSKFEVYNKKLNGLKENHLLRYQRCYQSAQLPIAMVDDQEMLLFSSSNYLSLSEREDLWEKAVAMAKPYGAGSGGSRLTTGNGALHIALEEKLAKRTGYEKALLFSSGYMANIGLLMALIVPNMIVFSDEKNHASIIDGLRMARAVVKIYPHLDMESLEQLLQEDTSNCPKMIISDHVFSMDGDRLDLEKFVALGTCYQALTVVDDAHGFGITALPYTPKPDVLMGCLSKAIGSEGAFVGTSHVLYELLKNQARSYMFSTSCSPFSVAFALQVLERMDLIEEGKRRLENNRNYLVQELKKIGISTTSNSCIIPIPIGDAKKAMEVGDFLLTQGILTTPIRYPAVPEDHAILRITLMAKHSKEDIDRLIAMLKLAMI